MEKHQDFFLNFNAIGVQPIILSDFETQLSDEIEPSLSNEMEPLLSNEIEPSLFNEAQKTLTEAKNTELENDTVIELDFNKVRSELSKSIKEDDDLLKNTDAKKPVGIMGNGIVIVYNPGTYEHNVIIKTRLQHV